jgi:hypothetical protein
MVTNVLRKLAASTFKVKDGGNCALKMEAEGSSGTLFCTHKNRQYHNLQDHQLNPCPNAKQNF